LGLADPELSVVLCDNAEIHRLNRQWRDEDKATDVLSFPLHEPEIPGQFDFEPVALGDIVISIEYADSLAESREHHRRVAAELGRPPDQLAWSLDHEVHFLLIHGLLHLVGHDHAAPNQERLMKAEERRLWELAESCDP
jgi:probable rRNA maturation factor